MAFATSAATLKAPYALISVVLIVLALIIRGINLPKIKTANATAGLAYSAWKYRNLILGAVGVFADVGAEVSIGSFLVNYFGLPEIGGLSARAAAGFVSFYWGAAMVGRFLGAGGLRRLKPKRVLAFCAVAAASLVCISMLMSGGTAMCGILAVGFFNSIMFPTIFSLGIAELGPLAGIGSGVLNMAIVGGAILPVVQGGIADGVGIDHAFVLPVLCYLYIRFYGLSGFKPNSACGPARGSDWSREMLVAAENYEILNR